MKLRKIISARTHTHRKHAYTHTHTCLCVYIYIYMYIIRTCTGLLVQVIIISLSVSASPCFIQSPFTMQILIIYFPHGCIHFKILIADSCLINLHFHRCKVLPHGAFLYISVSRIVSLGV
jgi:hypothetical protein